jgi:hypothetical protein
MGHTRTHEQIASGDSHAKRGAFGITSDNA